MKKELEFFNGYSIDDLGNVYGKSGNVLKPVLVCGYHRVSLPIGQGKFKGFLIHRLVAETFIPNVYNLPEVNHKNGDKTDNRVENLEWTSRSNNQLHKIHILGKNLNGERNPRHKLTEKDVLEIIELKKQKISHSQISKIFNISVITISNILNGVSWNHITGLPKSREYKRWDTVSNNNKPRNL